MSDAWYRLSHASADKIRSIQDRQVRKYFSHYVPYSPYYRELFKKHNLSFTDIRSTADLVKIPFTSKINLAPTAEDPAKPRQFILQPTPELIKQYATKAQLIKILWGKLTHQDVQRELEREYKPIHMHFTTGRTALPTPFTYSEFDVKQMQESGRRMLDVIKLDRNLVAINGFPYSPHLAFWLAYNALVTLGLTSLQTGGGKVMGTQKIIDAIERLKAGLLLFIPGYGYHLLREAVHQNRDFSNVKQVVFGGERVSYGLRDKVRELLFQLGAQEPSILATYAMTEGKTAWIQCHEKSGYHTYPDLEYFEVIDQEGNRVNEGEPGELVYTSLNWRGSVVVRYRTGDMCPGMEYGPCPYCGKTVPRIKPDIQRTSEIKEFHLTKVKGELVNMNAFYPLLSGMPEIDEWQVTIQKKNNDPFEVDELVVEVALKEKMQFDEYALKLQKAIVDEIGVGITLKQCSIDSLMQKIGLETELKDKRIIDARPKH